MIATALTCPEPARASDLAALLQRPVSPGSIALLVLHLDDAAARARVGAALGDPRAETRAAAARVATVSGLSAFVPALRAALAAETDPGAAGEQMRALGVTGGPAEDARILEAAKRLGKKTTSAAVTLIGRLRGTAALPSYFSTYRELDLERFARAQFFFHATRSQEPAMRAALEMALEKQDTRAVAILLEGFEELELELAPGQLVKALGATSPAPIRDEIAWYLVKAGTDKRSPEASALLAAVADSGPPAAGEDADDAFGRELLARRLGRAPVESAALVAGLAETASNRLDASWATKDRLEQLTRTERTALDERDKRRCHERDKSPRPDRNHLVQWVGTTKTSARTVGDLPRGLVPDVFAVAGCSVSDLKKPALASIVTRGDGRSQSVSPVWAPESPACRDAVMAIFALTLAPAGHAPAAGATELLLLPHDKEFLAALDPEKGDADKGGVPSRDDGPRDPCAAPAVLAGKATFRPQPSYVDKSAEGAVVVEVTVSEAGTVMWAKVVGSTPSVSLDLEAMRAALRWRFSPTKLRGVPVKVIGTVTFNFRRN
jgi:TonB family protein